MKFFYLSTIRTIIIFLPAFFASIFPFIYYYYMIYMILRLVWDD